MPASLTLNTSAIDVGFYSTKFVLGRSTNDGAQTILVDQFPSFTPSPASRPQDLEGMVPFDGATIEVDGLQFYVGKSSQQFVDASFGFRTASKDFCKTAGYKALWLGAIHYLARHYQVTEQLTLKHLAVGLPISTVFSHSKELTASVIGRHMVESPINKSQKIEVVIENVHVVAQPMGALLGLSARLGPSISDRQVLILDMGGGTFDWLLTDGLRPRPANSGAANLGTLECAGALCDQIDPALKSDPCALMLVDQALRVGSTVLTLEGTEYSVEELFPAAEAVLQSALEQMDRRLGSTSTVQHVLLSGGGAPLLKRVLTKRYPKLLGRLTLETDPVFSNVRGYFLLSERLAKIHKENR